MPEFMAGTLVDGSPPRPYVHSVSVGARGMPEAASEWWPVDSFGPVSIGAQIVGDRWTLLVVRELLEGATRFNDIHRGLPGLSRTLLASRLRRLDRLGLVQRVPLNLGGKYVEYRLTPAGEGLSVVIQALGTWTRDWLLHPDTDHVSGADASTQLWRFFRSLDTSALPKAGVGIEFRFVGGSPARGWIRLDRLRPRAGLGSPEGDADLVVLATPGVFDDLWSGLRECDTAIEGGDIVFVGPARMARDFRRWFVAPGRAATP